MVNRPPVGWLGHIKHGSRTDSTKPIPSRASPRKNQKLGESTTLAPESTEKLSPVLHTVSLIKNLNTTGSVLAGKLIDQRSSAAQRSATPVSQLKPAPSPRSVSTFPKPISTAATIIVLAAGAFTSTAAITGAATTTGAATEGAEGATDAGVGAGAGATTAAGAATRITGLAGFAAGATAGLATGVALVTFALAGVGTGAATTGTGARAGAGAGATVFVTAGTGAGAAAFVTAGTGAGTTVFVTLALTGAAATTADFFTITSTFLATGFGVFSTLGAGAGVLAAGVTIFFMMLLSLDLAPERIAGSLRNPWPPRHGLNSKSRTKRHS